MIDGRWWAALVTFERRDEEQEFLPNWAQGASGWMIALAPDEETAHRLLVRDVEHSGFRVLEIKEVVEIFGDDEIEEIDDHLAANFRDLEPGKRTIWGTLHCYTADAEA
jgi:hypothetical protein